MDRPTMYHIPVCPFSQRLEILLALKGIQDTINFHVVDITVPRPDWLLEKSRGTTALPIFDLGEGRILKESLVLMRFVEDSFPESPVARQDPYEHAVENMLVTFEGEFVAAGYRFVMNQDPERRNDFANKMLACYRKLDAFLRHHSPEGPFLFERFGWAETVFTPFFVRFAFLEYYEGFELPAGSDYERVAAWRKACLAHPAAQQVSAEEVVKVYYDYAKGAGNGTPIGNRERSSFVFEPRWQDRPWPPQDKYGVSATDRELGLLE